MTLVDMLELVASILGLTGWIAGVLILLLMAAVPLLERLAEPERPAGCVSSDDRA